jgi:hypothetical protein
VIVRYFPGWVVTDMEALPDGQQVRHLYRSQEFEVYLHTVRVELEAKKM